MPCDMRRSAEGNSSERSYSRPFAFIRGSRIFLQLGSLPRTRPRGTKPQMNTVGHRYRAGFICVHLCPSVVSLLQNPDEMPNKSRQAMPVDHTFRLPSFGIRHSKFEIRLTLPALSLIHISEP